MSNDELDAIRQSIEEIAFTMKGLGQLIADRMDRVDQQFASYDHQIQTLIDEARRDRNEWRQRIQALEEELENNE